ncbi:MAG: ABC transporter permease [Lachnospiraceae bacterium]|nr:ABC transporter permease [Lachnospiraceae bacterium]
MLREIDRKFYGEGTAAILAESGIRRKFGKKAVSSVTVISGSDGKNDGGRGPKSDISSESYLQTVIRRFKRHHLAAVSLIVLAVIVGAAILAPVIAPYDPNDIAGPFAEGPSKEFWLGTDQIGRDVLSRLLYATRISLLVGVMATLISTGIGVLFGLAAGYFGGVADMIIMRFTDMVMSFPYILLVLVAAAVFKPGMWNIILILGFVDWPGIARLVRGNVLSLRETNFVKGNIVAGMPLRHILFSEILPNTVAPILVYATSVLALSILDEAALSFLGQGVQPPTSSLGNMLNGAQSLTVLTTQPWLWIPPGLLIVVVVMAINFIGDALRDALDPNSGR